ncbi:hypothetical protein CJF30_00003133 [Rutstroemia sp. NJR-2017a BBW]|nr:hypothetical protein CJF30_00003133 [Rutstroemia sp. NJR-2017a BBW]
MLNTKASIIATAVSTIFTGVNAGSLLTERTQPQLPSCTNHTAFVYAGCFVDPSIPSALIDRPTGLDFQNMTIQICVDFCKGNGYKYAGLEYYGECFCGGSVNGMQTDESACSYPCTGDQTEVCGGFDIISVYQDTTFPTVDETTVSDYMPMGCWSDLGPNGRTLAWKQDQIPNENMTTEACLFACKQGGYAFAGTEYSQECWCGVVLGNGTAKVDDSNCAMPCNGNTSELCGGAANLNLYVAKDMESTEPCNGGGSSSSSSSSSSYPTSTTSSVSSSSSTYTSTTDSSSSTTSSVSSSSSTYTSTTDSSSSTNSTTTISSTTSSSSSSYSSPVSSTSSTSVSSTISSTSSSSSVVTYPTSPTSKPSTTSSTSKPTTTSPSTTKTSVSLCTSTTSIVPTPTCEYKCGNWCSNPIPTFTDKNSCLTAAGSCAVQLTSCLLGAGFPSALQCLSFASWCQNVASYCTSYCPGNSCSVSGCKGKYPPTGPSPPPVSYSTSVYTCPATLKTTTTSSKPSSTSSIVPVPTCSNICVQPNNPSKGYGSSSPVGNIPLPCLTCNNLQQDYNAGYPFKLYTNKDSGSCGSYTRPNCGQGCKDACDTQYTSCVNTYAQSCSGGGGADTYSSAMTKCQAQKTDCYSANSGVGGSGRCTSWNSGW